MPIPVPFSGSSGMAGVIARFGFNAPLQSSLVLSRGVGSPTYTRASVATCWGYGPTANLADVQIILEVASGEARFTGARRISEGVWSTLFTDGTAIPDSTLKGYLAEGARTQLFATADIRDMTTASWVLGATMTRARTSVGADGVANSATRLTGGAVAATNTCYSTFVAAASSRTYSALVKRVTGTGPVRIVQTGTETDISSLINSATYTLVQLNASVLNVAVGFKIDTSGDAIDVDFNQFEAGAFASSSMAVTGARAADSLTYLQAGNFVNAAGTIYAEALPATFAASLDSGLIVGNLVTGYVPMNWRSNGAVWFAGLYDGTNSPLSDTTNTQLGIQQFAASYGAGGTTLAGNGSLGTPTAYSGTILDGTAFGIGVGAGGGSFFGNIRNVRIAQVALSDPTLQQLTA